MLIQSLYRTCIPAEAEPILNSSSCYPLVNFSRPFCKNHGITLPNYVYKTPSYQNWKNDEGNKDYDGFLKLGASRISRLFKVDITTVRKCFQLVIIGFCHYVFPSCDRTQSVFKEQKICRESCLEFLHDCHKIGKIFVKYFIIRYPEKAKLYSCELQPYRNAGDSPECWYYNGPTNSTGNIIMGLCVEDAVTHCPLNLWSW
jgi:hypothetical protein